MNYSELIDKYVPADDVFLFNTGCAQKAWLLLGCRYIDAIKMHRFAVWAPNAQSVSLVGDFNGWDPSKTPMEKRGGIWYCFASGLKSGDLYKYCVTTQSGKTVWKSDPFAQWSQSGVNTASMVWTGSHVWRDEAFMRSRAGKNCFASPMSIYELHLGSWKTPEGGVNYASIAPELAKYCTEMGFTHIELLPLTEYPYPGSWGYQVTGYFAPTSRHGTPDDFRKMIDMFHQAGIGVILDWVPAHFPRDEHGLANFDGKALYEYADPKKGEHPDWGTKIFDYGRNEVKNFLIANALYWLTEYHVDGLRIDAVASMLYLDYGKQDGQWVANKYGENKNLEAIEFFRHLNSIVHQRKPGTVMIAEESTAWPMVTGDPEDGGLGFDLKWNMGWMNDFLEYQKCDPYFRKYNHNKMTFSMTYAYSENYILVISHDEVVHLKKSMLEKMPGNDEQKFANLKAAYAFMLGHPGKKLLFMGQEFGERREWSEARELDWASLNDPRHEGLKEYVGQLLTMYNKYPALYGMDDTWDGFQWINANDGDRSIFSFVRYSPSKRNNLLFVINFTPVDRPDYRVGVPKKKRYTKILSTEAPEIGGAADTEPVIYQATASECDGQPYSIGYPLPGYGVAVFKF